MNKTKLMICLVLAVSLMVPFGGVFAASTPQSIVPVAGTVCSITLDTDPSTGITTVVVGVEEVCEDQVGQAVRISQKSAEKLGLVGFDGDGKPVINQEALGQPVEIKTNMVIVASEADQHPVGSALATFFSDIAAEESLYEAIMTAHNEGVGFGVIAQVLWLTKEIPEASLDDFQMLLTAKQNGDFSDLSFVDANGNTIVAKNWGDLRKAVLEGKKIGNLGTVVSNKDDDGNGNGNQDQNKVQNNNKDKNKDKNNNGKNDGNGKNK